MLTILYISNIITEKKCCLKKHICKIEYPFSVDESYIKAHYQQENELKKILEKSGHKDEFVNKFRMRLKFLADRRKLCCQKSAWFEILKNESLYSMKIKGKKNVRILFSIVIDNNTEFAILLVSFEEKETKNYKKPIDIAKKRLVELFEETE